MRNYLTFGLVFGVAALSGYAAFAAGETSTVAVSSSATVGKAQPANLKGVSAFSVLSKNKDATFGLASKGGSGPTALSVAMPDHEYATGVRSNDSKRSH